MDKSDRLGLYLSSFGLASLMGPVAIQTHEIIGHWLPAKLLGAEGLSIGYSMVECGSAKDWHPSKQVPINAGGPVVSNLIILAGLALLKTENKFLKLVGWGLVITAYRGLIGPLRQLMNENKKEGEKFHKLDETLAAEGLGVSNYLISVPQALLSLLMLIFACRCLPGKNKTLVGIIGFQGNVVGVALYFKVIGPHLWPSQPNSPVLLRLGAREKLD